MDNRPVNQRGQEHQAEKLTGNRAQKGNLAGGAPRWTYEVKWAGNDPKTKKPWKTTWEPASCLIGWEKEMKEVDKLAVQKALLPTINPFTEALKARERAAKQKAEEHQKKRERLQRRQRRRARTSDDEESSEEGDKNKLTTEEEALAAEQVTAELEKLEHMLAMLAGGTAATAAGAAAAAGASVETDMQVMAAAAGISQGKQHKREGRSLVWKAFNQKNSQMHATALQRWQQGLQ